jgi:dTDP-4-amino-4,6-dideoxygalactose transaminase
VTNDGFLAERCRRFRDHGLVRTPAPDAAGWDGPWYYELHELGFNYRLTDLQAALGLVQLGRLRTFVHRRRTLAAAYDLALATVPGVRRVAPARQTRSAYHLYPVRVPAAVRRRVFDALRAAGIGVQVHYIPVHLQPYYRRLLGTRPGALPAAESFYAEALSLPCFPEMEDADVAHVTATLADALAACGVEGAGGEGRHADQPW